MDKDIQPCVDSSRADNLVREADDVEVSVVVAFGQQSAALGGWAFGIAIGVPTFHNPGRAVGEDAA